ncbi:MAG: hypothetical protein HY554_03560 [Elusimicrobia bacterium]|nr:hypothetical protein [Elusimicrobiota bacterium]
MLAPHPAAAERARSRGTKSSSIAPARVSALSELLARLYEDRNDDRRLGGVAEQDVVVLDDSVQVEGESFLSYWRWTLISAKELAETPFKPLTIPGDANYLIYTPLIGAARSVEELRAAGALLSKAEIVEAARTSLALAKRLREREAIERLRKAEQGAIDRLREALRKPVFD